MSRAAEEQKLDFAAMGRKRGWIDGTISEALESAARLRDVPEGAATVLSHAAMRTKEEAEKLLAHAVDSGQAPYLDAMVSDAPYPNPAEMTHEQS